MVQWSSDVRPMFVCTGAVKLLTNPASCGYVENPISVHYCYSQNGDLEKCIAERGEREEKECCSSDAWNVEFRNLAANVGAAVLDAVVANFSDLQYSSVCVMCDNLSRAAGCPDNIADIVELAGDLVSKLRVRIVRKFHQILFAMVVFAMHGGLERTKLTTSFLLGNVEITSKPPTQDINHRTSEIELFVDLSLEVEGCRNIYESLLTSCKVEELEGANQIHVEGWLRAIWKRRYGVFADRLIPLQGRDLEGRGSRAERQLAVNEVLQRMADRPSENPMYRLKLLTEVLGVQLERNASNPDVLTNRASRVNQYGPSDDGTSLSPFARDPIEAGSLAGGVLRSHRNVCGSPFKTLDAPDLKNDFYVNPVDWSSSDLLAISLGTTIYLWNATTQEVSRLCDLAVHHDDVSSVAWSRSSGYLAVGTQRGLIQLWDPNEKKKIRDIEEHWGRVGVVRWGPHTLASGGEDTTIRLMDIRAPGSTAVELKNHRSEVCGLEWSPDNILLASGGNDNVVNVWDVRGTHRPEWVISGHNAAVKALAWSPHNTRRLASGGGLSDTTIRSAFVAK
ncbi:hypothetical protein BSKO_05908 [Bryopsis sp. KO-2023]|nr:hypothetical protein BSKO_05908 [Bryopsis sp. KO-2023]